MKYLIIVFAISCSGLYGQPKKITAFSPGEVSNISVDRLGNFYLILKSGVIQKYNPDGKLLAQSSQINSENISVEAWNPLQVFAYSSDARAYNVLDHTLQNEKTIQLDSSFAISPHLLSPGNENSIWILDAVDYSVKKIDTKKAAVIFESQLRAPGWDDAPMLIQMREYQNLVFLLDLRSGISIFTSLGKLVRTIEESNIRYFNFMGEELYFLKENKIIFFDLYTEERRELKIDTGYRFALVTDERLILVRHDSVELFEFFLQ